MLKKFLFAAFVLLYTVSGFAKPGKQLYCHPGWGGGDHGFDSFTEVVISDKPIMSRRASDEAAPGYEFRKGAKSAVLSMSTGWDNKDLYGNDAVLLYRPDRKTQKSFTTANYSFAKDCLSKRLTPALKKTLETAALNPKSRKTRR